ncbi:MAG: class B sortase [Oscillospiraceae bacterium]|nr:class B sortase [Oscillospiraceae bacterium]
MCGKKCGKRSFSSKTVLCALLLGVFLYSGYSVIRIADDYRRAEQIRAEFSEFKPSQPQTADVTHITDGEVATEIEPTSSDSGIPSATEPPVNSSLLEAQKINGDILGWITVDGTMIDYPFVRSKDNADYLRTDLYGNYSVAGTVFMDYRCEGDLSSFNTILYGHKMKDSSMFSDLGLFADDAFWAEHTGGTLYLPDVTYTLEVFAYAVVQSTDMKLYAPYIEAPPEDKTELLRYIREQARQYREIEVGTDDQILLLSTCSYEYSGARSIVVAKITKAQ